MTNTTKTPARERILSTAHDLFYRHGVRATGIDRVIAESGVTKVTLYRHFPSKNELILAYLDYRHRLWMDWFNAALTRHGNQVQSLVPALQEWFEQEDFRGCAFLNNVAELAEALPQVLDITRNHKQDMWQAIRNRATATQQPALESLQHVITIAIDGAIVHTQYGQNPAQSLAALAQILESVLPQG
jgi:AcrR family transcriptional regulator